MSVTLSKSQFRKTGYSEQGPGRRLTVGAELGFEATIEKQSPKEILMKDIGTVANGATGVSYVCKQGMQVYSCTELCSTQQYPTDTVCQVNSLDLELSRLLLLLVATWFSVQSLIAMVNSLKPFLCTLSFYPFEPWCKQPPATL
ncbi:hypothetical protein QL285_069864 [Trifolium repens]|nr:hypothetical protein QL285_069864 [Trifolium repens]